MADIIPTKISILDGDTEAYDDSLGDSATFTPLHSAVLPPIALGGTFYQYGVLAVLSHEAIDATHSDFHVKFYDIEDGGEISGTTIEVNNTGATKPGVESFLYSGLSPLQAKYAGAAMWYPDDNVPTNGIVRVLLSQYVTTVGGNRRLIAKEDSLSISGKICDVSPYSKSTNLYLLVGRGETSTGDSQIQCVKATITDTSWPESPTDSTLLDLSAVWTQEVAPSWMADRPDTCLKVQNIPAVAGITQGIMALMGNWVSGVTVHPSVSNPRLVYLEVDGTPDSSHIEGYGYAHGMTVNQFGDIYVTGTADIVNGGDYLICKYNVDHLGATYARVLHGDDGLGDYTGDPLATHVITPTWNGSYLVVQDHGTASTRFFVYDKDLRYITNFTVSSTAVASGTRWRGSNKAIPWWGENY
ncbi:MAG: hypothetical protein KKF27_20515 [Gammaproteobacteria bacterium]|nr:hypothetical protein [Gammaproteobacteria bacterium]